ncbi:hypothetical protein [Streptomyces mangrovi]|uniref:hypothetical protein n=1 Tax=Streptomyces mangrovi TaxID=1206892 RepID=UPI00399D4AD6
MDDQEPEIRSIGCQIVCSPDVADEIAGMLREAVRGILEQYGEDEIYDYGVD